MITGGTGFIGSNLCKKLLLEGNRITCIDNNFTGSIENVKECLDNPNFTFINHNVIANSRFSWWGAYFNQTTNKIVTYPSTWFGPSLGNKKNG